MARTTIKKVCLLLYIKYVICDQCKHTEAEVSDSDRTEPIFQNDAVFKPKLMFEKHENGVNKNFTCVCTTNCVRKCCPLGSKVYGRLCVPQENDVNLELNLHFYNTFKRKENLLSPKLELQFGLHCVYRYHDPQPWYIQEDGSIYVETPNSIPPWTLFTPDRYCVDNFVTNTTGTPVTRLDALICFPEEQEENNYWLSSICMLVSIFFIMLTVSVYACVPELRNLHGRVLMAYLICLAIGFLVLASMKIMLVTASMYQSLCLIFTFIIYYFLEAAFFWLNVMCFDIWWTFSGKRGLSLEKLSWRGRFYAYAFYAFGVPLVLLVILASLEFSDLPPHPALPLLKQGGCFFGRSRIIYLYGPMLILFIANITFFIMTACKISSIDHQSSVLKSKESATHDQQNKDKQRFLLYIKLFMVMGLNWILEVISALYTGWKVLWTITDTYNVLIGLIIFIIFVCKRKTFRLIKKRINEQLSSSENTAAIDLNHKKNVHHSRDSGSQQQRGSIETVRTICSGIENNVHNTSKV